MEAVLNERSLEPARAKVNSLLNRVAGLAESVKALHSIGLPRFLRIAQSVPDTDLGEGFTLRRLCFQAGPHKEARQFLGSLLSKAPFVEALYRNAEGPDAVECRWQEALVLGLGLASLREDVAVSLPQTGGFEDPGLEIVVWRISDQDESDAQPIARLVQVAHVGEPAHVDLHSEWIRSRLTEEARSGEEMWSERERLFPKLLFGPGAEKQLRALAGNEAWWPQICRHLRQLNGGALGWQSGTFSPEGTLDWSEESGTTLKHGVFGPRRDFPVPDGFEPVRFSYHTKIFVGNQRIYFHPHRVAGESLVLIGYIGRHLPTVKFPK